MKKARTAHETTRESTAEFISKLAALCHEYGMGLGGCGCMGSPFISDKRGKVLAEKLCIDEKTGAVNFVWPR